MEYASLEINCFTASDSSVFVEKLGYIFKHTSVVRAAYAAMDSAVGPGAFAAFR